MTDASILLYITAAAAMVTACSSAGTLIIAVIAKKKVEEVRHSTNSMRDQLEAAAFARGVLQERNKEGHDQAAD